MYIRKSEDMQTFTNLNLNDYKHNFYGYWVKKLEVYTGKVWILDRSLQTWKK